MRRITRQRKGNLGREKQLSFSLPTTSLVLHAESIRFSADVTNTSPLPLPRKVFASFRWGFYVPVPRVRIHVRDTKPVNFSITGNNCVMQRVLQSFVVVFMGIITSTQKIANISSMACKREWMLKSFEQLPRSNNCIATGLIPRSKPSLWLYFLRVELGFCSIVQNFPWLIIVQWGVKF